MGCGNGCSKDDPPAKKPERKTQPKEPNEDDTTSYKKLLFGPAFSEQELYNSDPLILNSDEIQQKIKEWDTLAQGKSIEEGLLQYYNTEPKEFLKKVKEGPPAKYRWTAWKIALNTNKLFKEGIYQSLITEEKKRTAKCLTSIKADINRTYPERFKGEQRELKKPVIKSLENVLVAISIYSPDVGYCQGMNFVIAFMLFVSDMKEEEVFWTFIAFIKDMLKHDPLGICGGEGLYNNNFPKMEYMMSCFDSMFSKIIPEVKNHIDKISFPNILWVYKWVFVMFVLSFPFSYSIRFWDYILGHGLSGVLRLSLSIIMLIKEKLIGEDFSTINDIVNSFNEGKNLPSIEEIIETAEKIQIDSSMLPRNKVLPKPENEPSTSNIHMLNSRNGK